MTQMQSFATMSRCFVKNWHCLKVNWCMPWFLSNNSCSKVDDSTCIYNVAQITKFSKVNVWCWLCFHIGFEKSTVTVNWLSLLLIGKHNYCCFWIMVMMMMSKEQHVLISEILILMEICCVIYIALLITQSYLLGKKLLPDSGFCKDRKSVV